MAKKSFQKPKGAEANQRRQRPPFHGQKDQASPHRSPSNSGTTDLDTAALPGRKGFLELFNHQRQRLKRIVIADGLTPNTELSQALSALEGSGISIEKLPSEQLDLLTDGTRHQGILSYVSPLSIPTLKELYEQVILSTSGLVVFLDEISDPHNLGAILRAADAFGVQGIVTTRDRSAPLTIAAKKVSAGASELVPIVRVSNLANALREAKDCGISIVGTDLSDSSLPLSELSSSRPIGVVLGSEGKGMRRLTKELCDYCVEIPMCGHVDSLNVSQAAAIIFYAIRAQAH